MIDLILSEETKSYALLIITVLIFVYFASGLAADPEVQPGTVVLS